MAQYEIDIDRDECISCQQCVSDAPAMCGMDDDEARDTPCARHNCSGRTPRRLMK